MREAIKDLAIDYQRQFNQMQLDCQKKECTVDSIIIWLLNIRDEITEFVEELKVN